MSTFYMFGTYSAEMFRDVSAGRTKEIEAMVKEYGGKIIQMHVLIGKSKDDLVLVVDFPDTETKHIKCAHLTILLNTIRFPSIFQPIECRTSNVKLQYLLEDYELQRRCWVHISVLQKPQS